MRVAVVVPTIQGREAHLERCLAAYDRTDADIEVRVEYNHPSCGRAWTVGAENLSKEPDHLHLTADDLEPHDGWLEPAIEAVEQGNVPAPVVLNPDGSLQSAGLSGWDVYTGPYHDWMPVESTTVPFMSWEMWERIGMVDLHYCTDLWVSHQGRRHGWETVLREGYRFTHHNAPEGRDDQHGRTRADRDRFRELAA